MGVAGRTGKGATGLFCPVFIVDLAAVLAVAVDELVIEDAEDDVDFDDLAHPCPPCVSNIKGMAATAIATITMK